jgi:hypothetical protein
VPVEGKWPSELAETTFKTLFKSRDEYTELAGDKKRWARKELIELYIRNMTEETRLQQIETVKKTMIGDGK